MLADQRGLPILSRFDGSLIAYTRSFMKAEIASRSLIMASVLAATVASAQTDGAVAGAGLKLDDDSPAPRNRFGLSYRLGFTISARFKGLGSQRVLNPRLTPNGDAWNYDDGYNLEDTPYFPSTMTAYWGYTGPKATQAPGDGFLHLSQTTYGGDVTSSRGNGDPQQGLELSYNRELGQIGRNRWGLEGAFNYMTLVIKNNETLFGNAIKHTDKFDLQGVIIPDPPVYGTKGPPGGANQPAISHIAVPDTSVNITTTLAGQRKIDADVYGFRLGPYLEVPIYKRLALSLSGGLAVAAVNSQFNYNEVVSVPGIGVFAQSGAGSRSEVLFGVYAGGSVSYSFSKSWSAFVGGQYQNVGHFSHQVGGKVAELDFAKTAILNTGIGFSF